jgi:enoyl-CoA hydratase/carnithine racemase
MELKTTQYDVKDLIATITLNRPQRMNAWTGRMHTEYRWCLQQAEQDKNVGVIIVTGSENSFCVGADSQALEGHAKKGVYDPGTPDDIANPGYGVFKEFDQNFAYQFGIAKPIIAAVNGSAAGVGLVVACYADFRFAVKGAKLTTAHGKLNLPAEYGMSWLLPRLIGLTKANDLLFTSRKFTTDEAFKLGIMNDVFETKEELMAHVYQYAQNLITTISPESLASTKLQIYKDLHRGVGEAVAESDKLLIEMSKQTNYKEAIKAFIEKRLPNWNRD